MFLGQASMSDKYEQKNKGYCMREKNATLTFSFAKCYLNHRLVP